jgi:NAD dependent epimerase/dehydratase family enzyme
VHGGMNVVAPGVLREKDAGSAIGRAMNRPSWLHVPTLFLRLAMGQQSDLMIHGRRAEPKKALGAGYRFQHPLLDGALKQVLG